jgi:hypothetical protein
VDPADVVRLEDPGVDHAAGAYIRPSWVESQVNPGLSR